MHIPDAMLQGKVCPVTAVISAVGLIVAAWGCAKSQKSPSAGRFGAISAFIFAAQMINFPITHGTSAHLIGGVLAAGLLGIPFGVLSMALIITLQSLVFGDGGVVVLGANILNMALVGAGIGGFLRQWITSKWSGKVSGHIAIALAAGCSVILAATFASIELATDGQIAFQQVLPAMLQAHVLIGMGEAGVTVLLFYFLSMPSVSLRRYSSVIAPLVAASLIALVLSPFASTLPGGLELVAEKFNFSQSSQQIIEGIFPNYSVTAIANKMVSTSIAGLAGVLLTFAIAWIMFVLIFRRLASQLTLRVMNR